MDLSELDDLLRLVGFRVEENLDCRSDESPGERFLDRFLVDYSVNRLLLFVRISF